MDYQNATVVVTTLILSLFVVVVIYIIYMIHRTMRRDAKQGARRAELSVIFLAYDSRVKHIYAQRDRDTAQLSREFLGSTVTKRGEEPRLMPIEEYRQKTDEAAKQFRESLADLDAHYESQLKEIEEKYE